MHAKINLVWGAQAALRPAHRNAPLIREHDSALRRSGKGDCRPNHARMFSTCFQTQHRRGANTVWRCRQRGHLSHSVQTGPARYTRSFARRTGRGYLSQGLSDGITRSRLLPKPSKQTRCRLSRCIGRLLAQRLGTACVQKGSLRNLPQQKSAAQWAYERCLVRYLKNFEEQLDCDQRGRYGFWQADDAGVACGSRGCYFDLISVTFYGRTNRRADAACAGCHTLTWP